MSYKVFNKELVHHQQFSPFSTDLFTLSSNYKVLPFHSSVMCPKSDAFKHSGEGEEMFWACPPVACIPRVLRKRAFSKLEGILIIPALSQ
jgi:hypothetical protein